MAIMTIDDLAAASDDEVDSIMSGSGIIQDLARFQQWCEKEGYRYPVSFDLGGGGPRTGVHPSSVCKNDYCLQKLVWDATGEVEKINSFDHDLLDTFDIGTAKHAMLQAQLNEMYGDQFEDEVSLKDDSLHILGHTDGMFTFSNYRMLLEIKTIKDSSSAYGFDKATRDPLKDNVRQLMIYMKILNVPFGLLFYWCKNDSRKVEYIIAFDDELWRDIHQVIVNVCRGAYDPMAPKVIPKNPQFSCKWCGYLHACPEGKEHVRGTSRSRRRRMRVQGRS